MADRKISELTNITGANLADADEFVVVDTSASETKAITYGELKKFTGTVTADGLTVDGNPVISGTSPQLFLQTGATHYNWQIAAQENVASAFEISSGNLDADATNDTYTKRLVVQQSGDISFYEDTGTTPKMVWSASLEALGVGITPSTAMHVYSGSGNTALRVETGLTNGQAEINFKNDARRYNVGINSSDNLHFVDDTAGETRMTIDASGNLLVGTTSDTGGRVNITRNGIVLRLNTANTSNTAVQFVYNGSTEVGSITTTTISTAYNTLSDYRLKEDVQPMTGASDRVLALNPVNFAWKADNTRTDGFIAHEAQAVAPYAVTGEKDGEEMQSIDHSKLVPLLTAALQEALGRIETLEAEVAALKA